VIAPNDNAGKVVCPICGKPFDGRHSPAMPFCSERCRLIDLGRWLNEEYGVPHSRKDELEDIEG
jgi:endogenous inhibitor of DNA gyrase (YacG/DUF329 family)